MIYVSVFDHGGERVLGVARGKLMADMIFPKMV
jgi:hypothetical protein